MNSTYKKVDSRGSNVLALTTLVILIPTSVRDERVQNERGFGMGEGLDVLELAKLELCAGFFIALGWCALAHGALGIGGHLCGRWRGVVVVRLKVMMALLRGSRGGVKIYVVEILSRVYQ